MYTLEQLLEQHQITQRDLAVMLGVTERSVSAWVNGRPISLRSLALVCELFNLPAHQIHINIGRDARVTPGTKLNPKPYHRHRPDKQGPRTEEQIIRIRRGTAIAKSQHG